MTKVRSTTSRRRLKRGGGTQGAAANSPAEAGASQKPEMLDSHLVTPAQKAAAAELDAAATPSGDVEVQEVGKGAGATFMENAHWLYPLIIPLGCLLLMFFGVLGADDLELTEEQEELFFLIRGFVKMTQKEKFILIIALVCQLIFTITRAFSSKGGGGEGDLKGKRLSMKNAKKSLQARNLKRQAAGKKEWSMMFILWAIAAPIAMLIFICYAAFGFGDSLPERTDAWVYVRGMDVSKTDKEEFCKHLNCGWCPDTFGQSGDPTKPDPEKCKLGKAIK